MKFRFCTVKSHTKEYKCSECNLCYQCDHTYIERDGVWYVICPNGTERVAYPEGKGV